MSFWLAYKIHATQIYQSFVWAFSDAVVGCRKPLLRLCEHRTRKRVVATVERAARLGDRFAAGDVPGALISTRPTGGCSLLYFSNFTLRVSRTTVTRICPGYCRDASIFRAMLRARTKACSSSI